MYLSPPIEPTDNEHLCMLLHDEVLGVSLAHRSETESQGSHLATLLRLHGSLEEVPDGALLGGGRRLLPLEAACLFFLHLPASTGRSDMLGDV